MTVSMSSRARISRKSFVVAQSLFPVIGMVLLIIEFGFSIQELQKTQLSHKMLIAQHKVLVAEFLLPHHLLW